MAGSHVMELPRRILIGERTLARIGGFVGSLTAARRVAIVSGGHTEQMIRRTIDPSMKRSKITVSWHAAPENTERRFAQLASDIRKTRAELVIGAGGGRSVDAAKSAAFRNDIPHISVPTAASHDGIASPFVSIKGKKPHSIVASAPLGVFVDTSIVQKAPRRLVASGCGDLIANIVAVRDWELGRDMTGEYYGSYAASLARMSAQTIIDHSREFAKGMDIRIIVEALISAGVAAGIAGSSRPCSGAEHLFSHALDRIAPGAGLHGEKCGIGSIMTAKLQGQDWKAIRRALADVGAPTSAAQVGISEDDVVSALVGAQAQRPGRYTILQKVRMTIPKAKRLARDTRVI